MCGRFTLTNPGQLGFRFDVPADATDNLSPRYNIAPAQLVRAIVEGQEGRQVRQFRWGFRPPWARDARDVPAPINARAETVLDRTLFRSSVARRRCLMVADGFYEWQIIPGQKRKQPLYIQRRDGALFGIAGLYTDAPQTGGQEQGWGSCALITCAPNALMIPIHDRMPVLLEPQDEDLWLDPTVDGPERVLPLLRPFPADQMVAYPVSTAVNDVRHDAPDLIAPRVAA